GDKGCNDSCANAGGRTLPAVLAILSAVFFLLRPTLMRAAPARRHVDGASLVMRASKDSASGLRSLSLNCVARTSLKAASSGLSGRGVAVSQGAPAFGALVGCGASRRAAEQR